MELEELVNVEFQKFNAHSVTMQFLNDAPAHFNVLRGLLLKRPPEPRSKGVIAAMACRVAVLSVPECVVGVPLPVRFWRWVKCGSFAVKILANKRR